MMAAPPALQAGRRIICQSQHGVPALARGTCQHSSHSHLMCSSYLRGVIAIRCGLRTTFACQQRSRSYQTAYSKHFGRQLLPCEVLVVCKARPT